MTKDSANKERANQCLAHIYPFYPLTDKVWGGYSDSLAFTCPSVFPSSYLVHNAICMALFSEVRVSIAWCYGVEKDFLGLIA